METTMTRTAIASPMCPPSAALVNPRGISLPGTGLAFGTYTSGSVVVARVRDAKQAAPPRGSVH